MNLQQDWDSLCRRALDEAIRYAALHPSHAKRYYEDARAFGGNKAPRDGHELTQRRIAFTGMFQSWHHWHLAQMLCMAEKSGADAESLMPEEEAASESTENEEDEDKQPGSRRTTRRG